MQRSKGIALVVNSATSDLMVTAVIDILNQDHKPVRGRTLIDTCSTTNFMTEDMANILGLEKKECSIPIGALNTLTTISKGIITATIRSRNSAYERTLTFLTVPTISQLVPDQPICRGTVKIPSNIQLADPEFHRPAPVDLLLGAGTALSLLCVGQLDLSPPDGPDLYLQKTRLGWVIGGSTPSAKPSRIRTCHMTNELQFDLTRFWEIEEGPAAPHLTKEESDCETHFQEHVTRNNEGRYVVALPFNSKIAELGESRSRATNRLEGIERKLSRNPELKQQYHAVLKEYLELGHMTEVAEAETIGSGYYLPHHAVIKEGSLTTKVRVVFDGSAKTSTNVSLNDTLMVGPTIQTDLISLLIRFRSHIVVITGDIEKMYRQFLVRPEDRKYQRIIWTNSTGERKVYELNTVTFGLASAPYLAIRSLHQLAEDEAKEFPAAAKVLKEDLYVDDALTGAATKEEAIILRDQLIHMLERGGLKMRQWASNDPDLLTDLPASNINMHLQLGETSTIKTLGIFWNSSSDSIVYTVKPLCANPKITKRYILSETAKIFDPLGLLAPVIVTAKILMQKLWSLKLDWDESLPASIHTEWCQYQNQLQALNNYSFNRRTIIRGACNIQLHGFCDASERAYGACIYLRTTDQDGQIQTNLVCAKSRVAPLKTITIPRLELCGALLLSSLYITVKGALPHKINEAFFWTDSMIVLHWLRTPPQQLKTFVSNRIAEIQSKTNVQNWRHVRTHDNPADLASRGQLPEDFIQPSIWQHGPTWLTEGDTWPSTETSTPREIPETRQAACLATTTIDDDFLNLLTRYSSIDKLQRVIAYCLRFKSNDNRKRCPTVSELQSALRAVIKLTQKIAFSDELNNLKHNKPLNTKSKLLRLTTFIDEDGILRVGGRLINAAIPFAERHPIVLPKNHHITSLIIQREHQLHFHAGAQATLYAVRRRYWPLDGRSQVWKVIKNCIKCCKAKPPSVEYIMGNLPRARVTESRPFTHVGVDYCGPFLLKEKKYRNRNKIKAYVAVFVCLAVKAIHLEVVSDLTSAGFIAALRRFIARRGLCAHIYSDNGTNFVGANNELRELQILLKSEDHQEKVRNFLTTKSIEWHFTPPRSPHFGGLWEASVKSFKHHLRRVAGVELLFTFEEFNTLVIEIEAILNSRPLTPISTDPHDLLVLTPGHFLIGDSLTNLRDRDYRETPSNRLSTWQHLQKVKQDFWVRWHREYLNELTCRSKWLKGQHPIAINTIVLLREDHLPPLHWPMGRVTAVHPGTDGIIRAVTVKTSHGIFKRNVKMLAPLPIQNKPEQSSTTILSDNKE